MRIVIISLSLFLLAGCAGLSKDECLTADWQIIGFEDGTAGYSAARIGQHRQDCAKHGITPSKSAYDAGYQEGILTYCSFSRGNNAGAAGYSRLQVCPDNSQYQVGYEQGLQNFCTYDSGYDFGLAGGRYRNVCPQNSVDRFLAGYDRGREIYSLQSELYSLQDHLLEVIADRETNEAEQDALKQQIILDQSLTAEGRTQILLDIDTLRDIDDELEEEEHALELQITELQAKLGNMGIEI